METIKLHPSEFQVTIKQGEAKITMKLDRIDEATAARLAAMATQPDVTVELRSAQAELPLDDWNLPK